MASMDRTPLHGVIFHAEENKNYYYLRLRLNCVRMCTIHGRTKNVLICQKQLKRSVVNINQQIQFDKSVISTISLISIRGLFPLRMICVFCHVPIPQRNRRTNGHGIQMAGFIGETHTFDALC